MSLSHLNERRSTQYTSRQSIYLADLYFQILYLIQMKYLSQITMSKTGIYIPRKIIELLRVDALPFAKEGKYL